MEYFHQRNQCRSPRPFKDTGYHVSPFGPLGRMEPVHLLAANENHSLSTLSLAPPKPLTQLYTLPSSPHLPERSTCLNAFPVSPPASPWGNCLSPCPFFGCFLGHRIFSRALLSSPWPAPWLGLALTTYFPFAFELVLLFLFPLIWLSLALVLFLMPWLPLRFWLSSLTDFPSSSLPTSFAGFPSLPSFPSFSLQSFLQVGMSPPFPVLQGLWKGSSSFSSLAGCSGPTRGSGWSRLSPGLRLPTLSSSGSWYRMGQQEGVDSAGKKGNFLMWFGHCFQRRVPQVFCSVQHHGKRYRVYYSRLVSIVLTTSDRSQHQVP